MLGVSVLYKMIIVARDALLSREDRGLMMIAVVCLFYSIQAWFSGRLSIVPTYIVALITQTMVFRGK